MKIVDTSFKYLFEIYEQTFDDKDPPRMSGWNRDCLTKRKKQCLNMLGQENFYLTHPPT